MNWFADVQASFPVEFVEALGWSLLHSLWQFLLIALFAHLCLRFLDPRKSFTRYAILVGLLGLAALCPIVGFLHHLHSSQAEDVASIPSSQFIPGQEVEGVGLTQAVGADGPQISNPASAIEAPVDVRLPGHDPMNARSATTYPELKWSSDLFRPWLSLIVAIWLIGVVVCSTRPLIGWFHLRRLIHSDSSSVPVAVQNRVARLACRLGLERKVRVLESALVQVPLVVGYFRPTIMLPLCFVTQVTPSQLQAILTHELAHIRRHDFVVNVVQILVESLYFYHPLVWWLSKQIRIEREYCCDDIVLSTTSNRIEYGRALLAVEELRGSRPLWSLGSNDGSFSARIQRIAGLPCARNSDAGWLGIALILGIVGIVISLNTLGSTDAYAKDADGAEQSLAESAPQDAPDDSDQGSLDRAHLSEEAVTGQARARSEQGLEFLQSHPHLRGLSLNMTRQGFLDYVAKWSLPSVAADDESYVVPADRSHSVIVMFLGDACRGIQRIRADNRDVDFTKLAAGAGKATVTAIRYPHCIIDVENLAARSLVDAIDAFNARSQESPIGVTRRPVTLAETLAAISKSAQDAGVAAHVKQVLQHILATKSLPKNAYFRRFTRFDDDDQMNGVWWVRLVIEVEQLPIFSVPIRSAHIFARPYTQLERKQHAQEGMLLINRFSSFFADLPTEVPVVAFPEVTVRSVTGLAAAALESNDFESFASLVEWDGAAESTRAFVRSEFEALAAAEIHSLRVVPRRLRGKLLHWSAFQHYEPNLDIAGYLAIEHTPANRNRRRTVFLELGKRGDQLRLVNYIAVGKPQLPKRPPAGLSTRGHVERLDDGTYLTTTIISNPGSLLSAHLANEEVWLRDFEKTRESTNIEVIAKRIAANAQGWRLDRFDLRPSVHANGRSGFRVLLKRSWKEYTGVPQQRAVAAAEPNLPFVERHAYWEFVLVPTGKGGANAAWVADFKSQFAWSDNGSPYHTRPVFLGTGNGHLWFSRATVYGQEMIRQKLSLQGGDDRMQLLIDGLLIDDVGTMTANTCKHLLARFGDACLPRLAEVIDAQASENAVVRSLGTLAHVRTSRATEMLKEYYQSSDSALRAAAVYALVHKPYRKSAKDVYLDMLRRQDRIDRLASACEAAVEFNWTDAIPILQQRIERPNSVRELIYTLSAQRSLQANPIANELLEAKNWLNRTGNLRDEADAKKLTLARNTLVKSEDVDAANLLALSLTQFVTKGDTEPVQRIGIEILSRRPRESTVRYLLSLASRLPREERSAIESVLAQIKKMETPEPANSRQGQSKLQRSGPDNIPLEPVSKLPKEVTVMRIDELIANAGIKLANGRSRFAELTDLFEEVPPGSKSFELKSGVIRFSNDVDETKIDSSGACVFYVPDKNLYYIQRDPLGSSVLHYYGPFSGDPREYEVRK